MESVKLLTIKEAAEVLRCHTYTIRRLVWRKRLPCVRVGKLIRIPEKAIREWEAKAMQSARLPVER